MKTQLADLQIRTDAASVVEVIRRSLAVYDMLMRVEELGGKIQIQYPDGTSGFLGLAEAVFRPKSTGR